MNKDELLVQQDRIIEEYQLSNKYSRHALNCITNIVLGYEEKIQESIQRINDFYNPDPDSFVWRLVSNTFVSNFELVARSKKSNTNPDYEAEGPTLYARIELENYYLEGRSVEVKVYCGPYNLDREERLKLYHMLPYSKANYTLELERFRKAVIEKLIEIGISINPDSINSDVFG